MDLLTPKIWAKIKPVFATRYPNEAIVAIFPNGKWRELENVHPDPRRAFMISNEDTVALLQKPPALFLHSHPNGTAWPSDTDTERQLQTGWNWGIVAIEGNPEAGHVFKVGYPEIWGPDVPRLPLEGRTALWGIRDCWTLADDYYASVGRELPRIPRVREPGDHHTEPRKVDPFRFWAKELGFRPVARADREPGDLVIMCWNGPRPNHVAIYLGDNRYLHQLNDGLSKVHVPKDEELLLAKMAAEFWRLPK